MPPLVGLGLVAAAGAYLSTTRHLTEAYDRDLGDIARAVVPYIEPREGGIALAFTPQADAVLRADSSERIYYAVLDERGVRLAGDASLPPVAAFEGAGPVFWNAAMGAREVRMTALRATVQGTPVIVVAAETTSKRDAAARDALFSAIAPVAILAAAALAFIVIGVGRGLLPVDLLRKELQARSHLDLSPVAEETVVQELKPLVHELNEMLARLEVAQRTQTQFLADAAHQLRTPIAGLVTQLDLARTDEAARVLHLEKAREGAARLVRLAQQVLSLAAADPVSNPQAPRERCDLAGIVEGRADAWLRTAMPRGVELEFDLGEAPIEGNAVLVGELATNLVDNAVRYGARNVKIATRREGARSLVEVSDDGPGIAPAERSRVFERFQRLDGSGAEGSGLGLAIVHEIAERHGAVIDMGEAPVGGTRIRVAFPAA
jgi:two-component system sensor histidine kinase TctE